MKDSNEPDQKNMHNRALVTLALGVTKKHSPSAVSVSDDDLISFFQGQLDDQVRSQVMNAIANDDSTYQRWIDLVQTNALADKLTLEANEEGINSPAQRAGHDAGIEVVRTVKSQKGNILSLSKLRSWLREVVGWRHTYSIGGATILTTVLVVFLVPRMVQNPTLDELYDQYAMSGAALLPEKSFGLSVGEESNTYSVTETELAKGIASGFEELGANNLPLEWKTDPTRYSDTEKSSDPGMESPYVLGKLVALSLIQCRLTGNSKYFVSAAPLMRKLVNQQETFAHLIVDSGSVRDDVCKTANAIIKLV